MNGKPRIVHVTEPALEEKKPPTEDDYDFLEKHPAPNQSKTK